MSIATRPNTVPILHQPPGARSPRRRVVFRANFPDPLCSRYPHKQQSRKNLGKGFTSPTKNKTELTLYLFASCASSRSCMTYPEAAFRGKSDLFAERAIYLIDLSKQRILCPTSVPPPKEHSSHRPFPSRFRPNILASKGVLHD